MVKKLGSFDHVVKTSGGFPFRAIDQLPAQLGHFRLSDDPIMVKRGT